MQAGNIPFSFRSTTAVQALELFRVQSTQVVANGTAVGVGLAKTDQMSAADRALAAITEILIDAEGNSSVSVTANGLAVGVSTGKGDDDISIRAAKVYGVYSGAGNDGISIWAQTSTPLSNYYLATVDNVDGEAGDDNVAIKTNGTVDRIYGGGGNDTIDIDAQISMTPEYERYYNTVDRVSGGSGDDTIRATSNGTIDRIEGGGGNDTITLKSERYVSRVYGDDGDDTINITSGREAGVIKGGDGNDVISIAAFEAAQIFGDEGDDTISITADRINNIQGGTGNDTLIFNSTSGKAAFLQMAEDHGHDRIETNVEMMIRVHAADSYKPVDQDSVSAVQNVDGTTTISFGGGAASMTVMFTGELAGKKVAIEWNSQQSLLVKAVD